MKSNTAPTIIPERAPGEAGGAARRVAFNTLNPFAAQLFTKVLMLGYAIVQFRVLGSQANGVLGDYFVAGIVLLYTSTIAEWGLGTFLTREVAKERDSERQVSTLFRRTLTLRLGISLALFLPVALFILLYGSFSKLTIEGAWAVAILTLSLLPAAFSGSVTAVLYAYERMSLPAMIGIVTAFLNVTLGIGAIAAGWGVIGLAVAALVSTCLTAIIFIFILRRNFPALSIGFDYRQLAA